MTADNVPVEMKCPDCRKRIKSVVYSRLTDDARFAAGCLGCCAYAAMQGSDEFKVNRHHCPNCGIEIGCIVTTAHPDGTQTFRVLTPEEAKAAEPKVFKS
ncbi:hypothetical protein EC988_000125 [Linderina pennispora]|nr:hypothetical protein EC988_000125 [Linderina pennispora]